MAKRGSRVTGTVPPIPALLAVLLVGLASPARALNVCNGLLQIGYVSGPNFPNIGDTVRVQLTLGAGSITGVATPTLTLNRVRFDLDCQSPPAPGSVPCTDDGSVIKYLGDGTITTTCPAVTFSTGHAASDSPNEVVFTPSAPIVIPASNAAFCQLQFDVQVVGPSTDGTPSVAEEVTGYNAAAGDAQCNNGLASSGAQSGSMPLCPVCNDNDACTTDACNNDTGECSFVPNVVCDDDDLCTSDTCNPATGQCVFTPTVTCNDDDLCTNDSCNPATGQCVFTPNVTCDDHNLCTSDSCNPATGQCVFTPTVTCSDNNLCTSDSCNPTTGQCVFTPTVTCNSNDACATETCNPATGQCEVTSRLECDDNNPCTQDRCDPVQGCVHTETVCDTDNNPCTGERCNPETGQCEFSGPGMASFLVRVRGRFGNGSEIDGRFGANEFGGSVQLGKQSHMSDGNDLIGDTVNLGNGSNVFRVLTNNLHKGFGVVIRDGVGTPSLPIETPYCPIPTISCIGGAPVTVERNTPKTLTPATYGATLVKTGGTLTFAGPGTFTLCSLLTARGATINVTGGATINIAGDLRIANGSSLTAPPSEPLPVINAAGLAVRVGAGAVLEGVVSAPNATFSSGRSARLLGAFCVDGSRSDKGVMLTCPPSATAAVAE